MAATINSVRQKIMNTLKSRLQGITGGSTYSRDLETNRVYTYKRMPTEIAHPSCIIVRGEEKILKQYSDRWECRLMVDIGFCDTIVSEDPSDEADQFLADIQLAIGTEFSVTAEHHALGSDVSQTVQLDEIGNKIEVSEMQPSLILGRITYAVTYRRYISDPSKH